MNRIITRSGVICLEIHGCSFLVADREARKICPYIRKISETGAFVWKLLSKGNNIEEIIHYVNQEFEVPESVELIKEINYFINNLKEHNYIIEEKE